jgi:hypothetical protein
MRPVLWILAGAMLLAGCTSPPKPLEPATIGPGATNTGSVVTAIVTSTLTSTLSPRTGAAPLVTLAVSLTLIPARTAPPSATLTWRPEASATISPMPQSGVTSSPATTSPAPTVSPAPTLAPAPILSPAPTLAPGLEGVAIATDHNVYGTGDVVVVTVHNGLQIPIFGLTGRTYCTIVSVQRKEDRAWREQGGCLAGAPPGG